MPLPKGNELDVRAGRGTKRSRPDELLSGAKRIIIVRTNYLASDIQDWKEAEHARMNDLLATEGIPCMPDAGMTIHLSVPVCGIFLTG